jgi:hypothetical protein
MKHKGLNQLLCAAVVDHRFRETLLRDPARAIATGYLDHDFSLTSEERDLVRHIRAEQLEDFATQVYLWISRNGNGNGHKGNGHSGNGRNGNGHGHVPLGSGESFYQAEQSGAGKDLAFGLLFFQERGW